MENEELELSIYALEAIITEYNHIIGCFEKGIEDIEEECSKGGLTRDEPIIKYNKRLVGMFTERQDTFKKELEIRKILLGDKKNEIDE